MIAGVGDKRVGRWLTLGLLLLVYVLNWIDRQILGILAPSIKADLSLTDAQMGMLGGLAFALLYSCMSIPLGWIADRWNRTWVITGSVAAWSLFTALCGIAGGFAQLFAARVGVGVGEAGGVAPSYSMIAEVFPIERKSLAFALYSLGIPIGSAAGLVLGAWLAHAADWRHAFFVVGAAGLAVAPVFRLLVYEPAGRRRGSEGAASLSRGIGAIVRQRSFWLLAGGNATSSMMGYGLLFWLPSFVTRSHGLDLVSTSYFVAGVVVIGGAVGILVGGLLGDRLGSRDPAMYARVAGFAFLATAPLLALGLSIGSLPLAFLLLVVPQALSYVWLAPVMTAVQHLVPSGMRATASACFLLIGNLVGLGAGSTLVGGVSDLLSPRFGSEALRYALLAGLPLYLLAAVLMLGAATQLRREWIAD